LPRPTIEIDSESGFCFGVVRAIRNAEQELEKGSTLYCLGDIVHNSNEVERLRNIGLQTITHTDLAQLHDTKVLLRAHGDPPQTYLTAKANNIEIIDATCPVVLQLQQRIKEAYNRQSDNKPLIIIYGKRGHAEVNGLVGQTNGEAIVIEDEKELDAIDLRRDVELYSQTTKSISGFHNIVEAIRRRKKEGGFTWHDTICRQVANRMSHIQQFAGSHDVIVFVCGQKSSNGKVLFQACKDVNPNSYMVSNGNELDPSWYSDATSIGICGATSTPSWLMNNVKIKIEETCPQ
jgi:4-hydroxy-3-methylbut-2-enyl diphosphate reductase